MNETKIDAESERLAIGRQIDELRRTRGLTRTALAGRAGIDSTALGRMLRGQYTFSDYHLVALARALSVDLIDLIPGAPSADEQALLGALRAGEREAALERLAALLGVTVVQLTGRLANPAPMPPVQLAGVGQASVALAAQIAQTITDNPAEAAQLVTDWVGATR